MNTSVNSVAQLYESLRQAIIEGDSPAQLQILTALQKLINDFKGPRIINIDGIHLPKDSIIELGNIEINFSITNISGPGRLIFRNTNFNGSFTLSAANSFRSITFENCRFGTGVNLSQISNRSLRIRFINSSEERPLLALHLKSIKVRSIWIEKYVLIAMSLNQVVIEKYYFEKSEINHDVLQIGQTTHGAKLISISNCTYNSLFKGAGQHSIFTFSIYIKDSTFKTDIRFPTSANFQKGLILENCTISEDFKIDFQDTTFNKQVRFSLVECEELKFLNCTFVESFYLAIDTIKNFSLVECQSQEAAICIGKVEDLKITGTNFHNDFHLENCNINQGSFEGSIFHTYASFKRSLFKIAPNFNSCKFTHSTSFHGCIFKDVKSQPSEGRYRILKDLMRGIANDADEILFSSYELQSRQKELWKSDKIEFILSVIYRVANQYGRSIVQPFLCMIFLWFCFGATFYSTESFYIEDGLKRPPTISITPQISAPNFETTPLNEKELSWLFRSKRDDKIYQAAVFSGINMLGPLRLVSFFEGFKLTKFRYVLLTWIQSTIATILWYLFITGIKRRFRTG